MDETAFLASPRVFERIGWIAALDAFDRGDRQPLERMLASRTEIPDELRPALAAIVAGSRTPKNKSKVKLGIAAADRMRVAFALLHATHVYEAIARGRYRLPDAETGEICSARYLAGDAQGVEEAEIARDCRRYKKELVASMAREEGIASITMEKLLAEARKKIRDYPSHT